MKKRDPQTQEQELSRRGFLTAIGLSGVGFSGLLAAVGNFLYLKPAVNYGPAKVFRAGSPIDYKEGVKVAFEEQRVVVVREKNGFAALSMTCTHLGCTTRISDIGFECPCHGSQFDNLGYVTGGPAPMPLDWYQVVLAPNGELEVDKSVKVEIGTFFNV
jgi:cytochrome b6-f complex iron-sulfur subunit